MQEISSYTSAVAAAVEQQNAATGEISHNVASAAAGAKAIVRGARRSRGRRHRRRAVRRKPCSRPPKQVESATEKLRSEVEAFLGTVAA